MLNFFKTNKILILVTLFFIVLFFLYLENQSSVDELENEDINFQVCIRENCFNIEIADDPKKRKIGLMNRNYLGPETGMLFIFEKMGVYKFWMKNTLIPLDMIWVDSDKKIIYIEKNTQPCKVEKCELFGPNEKAKYVLEINGGLAEKNGIKVGDEIELR
ncbi:MAG: DUF192 domain-containing protein [Patescibacteria group bacterium]|nr:DUF192 domain-containing protein [Patescibacteria group bacterium]